MTQRLPARSNWFESQLATNKSPRPTGSGYRPPAVTNLAQESAWASWQNGIETNCVQQPKAFGAPFRMVFFDQRSELGPGEMLEQLIEETRDLYDGFAFLVGASGEAPARNDSPTFIIGGLFFAQSEVKPVWDKSDAVQPGLWEGGFIGPYTSATEQDTSVPGL